MCMTAIIHYGILLFEMLRYGRRLVFHWLNGFRLKGGDAYGVYNVEFFSCYVICHCARNKKM